MKMTKRLAAREAKNIAAGQIMSYMEVGQPNEDHGCEYPCAECETVREALRNLATKLEEQAGADVRVGYWWER
jgi:hypothetical protein